MLSLREKLTVEEVNDMVTEADPCGLGCIRYKEFVKFVFNTKSLIIFQVYKYFNNCLTIK